MSFILETMSFLLCHFYDTVMLVDGSLSACFFFHCPYLAKEWIGDPMSVPHNDGGNLLMRSLAVTGVIPAVRLTWV